MGWDEDKIKLTYNFCPLLLCFALLCSALFCSPLLPPSLLYLLSENRLLAPHFSPLLLPLHGSPSIRPNATDPRLSFFLSFFSPFSSLQPTIHFSPSPPPPISRFLAFIHSSIHLPRSFAPFVCPGPLCLVLSCPILPYLVDRRRSGE